MKHKHTRLMCIASVFTALVFVVTAYLHIPTNNGYIHVGDGLIYIADCLTGFAVWAPGSVIIKALTALLFTYKGKKMMCLRNWLALIPAAVICAGGYYLYESLLYGNFIAALTGIPASLTQSVTSSILFVSVGLTIDKTNYKSKLIGGLSL